MDRQKAGSDELDQQKADIDKLAVVMCHSHGAQTRRRTKFTQRDNA
jgi:hypothetical protein